MMTLLQRRHVMKLAATASAIPCLTFSPLAVSAEDYDGKFLIFCTFEGGWDQLASTDPRNQRLTQFSPGKNIDPYYDEMSDIDDVVEGITGGTGVYTPGASNVEYGPSMYELAKNHWADLCVIRGVDMGTLTHAVGRRYSLTGKFPRGLQASGASMVTAATANMGAFRPVPNLVFGMETFNEGMPPWAAALSVQQPDEILSVLEPLSAPLDMTSTEAIRAFLQKRSAHANVLNGGGLVETYEKSIPQAFDLSSGVYARYFDLSDTDTQAVANTHFSVTNTNHFVEARGQAFMAAQAVSQGLAQCVSIKLAQGLDHHDEDLLSDHAGALREGFSALDRLMSYLKITPDKNGKPLWDRTVIVATSEFGRTPYINSQYGRDHHLSNSYIVAGAGIQGNHVVGGTNNTDYMRNLVNPTTGESLTSSAGGLLIRPADVHATIFEALGLSWAHLENQVPTILASALS